VENAGVENAGVENAGVEYVGVGSRAGKYSSGKCGSYNAYCRKLPEEKTIRH